MQESLWVKKFYRDFSEEESVYLEDILDYMCGIEIEIPSHVIQRMVERDIMIPSAPLLIDENNKIVTPGISDVLRALETGFVYEISNEGSGHTMNPYRMVVAMEDEGITLFIKVAPSKSAETAKVLDVWKRHGPIPSYPPIRTIEQFNPDWDFVSEMESFFKQDNHQDALADA
jgi:hypothetical protein